MESERPPLSIDHALSLLWGFVKYRSITKEEIQKHIPNPRWQEYRKGMKGASTEAKIYMLALYAWSHQHSPGTEVQVINYINALKRGGQLKI